MGTVFRQRGKYQLLTESLLQASLFILVLFLINFETNPTFFLKYDSAPWSVVSRLMGGTKGNYLFLYFKYFLPLDNIINVTRHLYIYMQIKCVCLGFNANFSENIIH